MTITLLSNVPVVPSAAILPAGSGYPWASSMSGAWYPHVPAPVPGSIPAMARLAKLAEPRRVPSGLRPFAVTAGRSSMAGRNQLVDNRKQHDHKTRVNAGGDGATGPHPEREPA